MILGCALAWAGARAEAQEPPRPPSEKDLAAELAEFRRNRRRDLLETAQKEPGDGWEATRQRAFVVLGAKGKGRSSYAKQILDMAHHLHEWREDGFGRMFAEKPPATLLRLEETRTAESPFRQGAVEGYVPASQELVFAVLGERPSSVGLGLFVQYLDLRHPALWANLPPWMSIGLRDHLNTASLTKRLDFIFQIPINPGRTVAGMIKSGRMFRLYDVMKMSQEEITEGRDDGYTEYHATCHLLFRFLTTKGGNRGKTEGILGRLLGALAEGFEAAETKAWARIVDPAGKEKPLLPDERRAALLDFEARSRKAGVIPPKELRKIQDRAFDEAFKDWPAQEWERLDKAFEAWLRAGMGLR